MKKLVLPFLFAVSALSASTVPPPPPKTPVQTEPPPGPVVPEKKGAKPHKIEKILPKEGVVPSAVDFNLPGIIGIEEGVWRGTDHLLNLTNNIYVEIDMMMGEDVKFPFTELELKHHVEDLLMKAGFKTNAHAAPGEPPLPYLHFLVMAQKCHEEIAVYIQARLFEKVKLDRVALPHEVVFQAITWEDENLLVISPATLKKDFFTQIDEMSGYFIQRYNFFEKETNRMKAK